MSPGELAAQRPAEILLTGQQKEKFSAVFLFLSVSLSLCSVRRCRGFLSFFPLIAAICLSSHVGFVGLFSLINKQMKEKCPPFFSFFG